MQPDVPAESPFSPCGVVTLMTDFGLSEPYVAIMKGVILARCPTAQLIDLTHQVPPFQTGIAGFWLARTWQYFPVGTVHLAVVDPGVGTERGMVVLETGGQICVAPDNGLLEPVFCSAPNSSWRAFQIGELAQLVTADISHTFHGRDIFAPLVAEIITGRLLIKDIGQPKSPPSYRTRARRGEGRIIGADHFGNLITDIPAADIRQFKTPVVLFRGRRLAMHKTYGDAPASELLALINSWGTVEIAEAQGNAQRALQAMTGEIVTVTES